MRGAPLGGQVGRGLGGSRLGHVLGADSPQSLILQMGLSIWATALTPDLYLQLKSLLCPIWKATARRPREGEPYQRLVHMTGFCQQPGFSHSPLVSFWQSWGQGGLHLG